MKAEREPVRLTTMNSVQQYQVLPTILPVIVVFHDEIGFLIGGCIVSPQADTDNQCYHCFSSGNCLKWKSSFYSARPLNRAKTVRRASGRQLRAGVVLKR